MVKRCVHIPVQKYLARSRSRHINYVTRVRSLYTIPSLQNYFIGFREGKYLYIPSPAIGFLTTGKIPLISRIHHLLDFIVETIADTVFSSNLHCVKQLNKRYLSIMDTMCKNNSHSGFTVTNLKLLTIIYILRV